jgi:hypothetical protein
MSSTTGWSAESSTWKCPAMPNDRASYQWSARSGQLPIQALGTDWILTVRLPGITMLVCETSGCPAPAREDGACGYAQFVAGVSGLSGNHGALNVAH